MPEVLLGIRQAQPDMKTTTVDISDLAMSRNQGKVAGTGLPPGAEVTFPIGQENDTMLRQLLWKNNILIDSEDIGGSRARTMCLHLQDGPVAVESEGKEVSL